MILRTKKLPALLNHLCFIDVSKGPNAQISFKSRSKNLILRHNDNFLDINIICTYEISYSFVNDIEDANVPKMVKKRLNQDMLDDTLE